MFQIQSYTLCSFQAISPLILSIHKHSGAGSYYEFSEHSKLQVWISPLSSYWQLLKKISKEFNASNIAGDMFQNRLV